MASQQVAELESHLGVRLLQRARHRLSLTDTGQSYYERDLQRLVDLDEAESWVRASAVLPQGTLRLTCAVTPGVWHVATASAALVAQHPQVQVDLVEENPWTERSVSARSASRPWSDGDSRQRGWCAARRPPR